MAVKQQFVHIIVVKFSHNWIRCATCGLVPNGDVIGSVILDEVEIRPHGDAQFILAIVVRIGDGYAVSTISRVSNPLRPHCL